MPTLFVATNGLSVWTSSDGGETLERMPSSTGLYSGSRVWSLAETPRGLLAGTDSGIYRWNAATNHWMLTATLGDSQLVTTIACAPDDPDILLAGTQPGALFRSEDGGKTWRDLEVPIKPYVSSGFSDPAAGASPARRADAATPRHWTRVTQIVFDPADGRTVWAGVEIDGAWRSNDRGQTWTRCSRGLQTDDVHGFAMTRDENRVVYATTNRGLYYSRDDGDTWQERSFNSPWRYTRSIVSLANNEILLTNGDGSPGTAGRLYRSRDMGCGWDHIPLPAAAESSLYFLATHPSDPRLIYAATAIGQIYRSADGGAGWTVLKRRLGEIRALLWVP